MPDDIPDEISVYKLIQSHVVEINALKRQCKTKQCKQNLQRIPRHMRRRAASNNPKRLPKSLQHYSAKTTSGSKKKKKSKSRNVKTRNKDPRRTPLHLWFAKRFKLTMKWGGHIPYQNNCKNQRLLYRCGKKGYTIFYLPFIRSLLFDYSNSSKDACFGVLSHFLSPQDVQSLTDLKDTQQCTVQLHEHSQFPFALLGPLQCTLLEQQSCLLVNAHVATVDSLVTALSPHLHDSFTISQQLPLSHIRLYGVKASHHLNRLFFPKKKFLSDQMIPLNQLNCFQVQNKDKTPESECAADLRQFIGQSCDSQPVIIALHRHVIGKMESIDLMVANVHLKAVWNRLTENMSHLVGGLRDLEVLALEARSTFFPNIGFFDSKVNQENALQNFELKNRYVIRDESIIDSLSKLLLNNCLTNIEHKESATVYVTIDFVKGKPRQQDLIYLPDTAILESYLAGTGKVQEMKVAEEEGDAQTPIGFVEFGSFSLDAAKCRAIALVTLMSLEKMITTTQKLPSTQNKLYAVVKTKFNIVNLVTVSVMKQIASSH